MPAQQPAGAGGATPPYGQQQQQPPHPGAQVPPQQYQQQLQGMPGATAPYPGQMPGAPAPYPGQMQGAPAPYPGQMMPQQQQQQGVRPPAAGPGMSPGAGPIPGASAAGGAPGGLATAIHNKLSSIVAANQLQRFYPAQALGALSSRLDSRVNFRDLAARWSMPLELALDLAALALYDVVIVADDSGSMAFEENGERIEDLKMIAQKVSEVATLFDDDGILVRFMNSDVQGNGIRSPADVSSLLGEVQYSGLTPLATSLQSKVLGPIVFSLAGSGQLAKPVLVITITDGEPTDNPKDLVVNVIKDAQSRLAAQYGPKAVAFEFCQVGKDQRAQAFLARLDTDPQVGGSIDCTSYYEMESAEYVRRGINLSPQLWLVKMMCGAIDPSYDEADE